MEEIKDKQLLPPRPPLVLPADPAGFGKNFCKGNSLAGSMKNYNDRNWNKKSLYGHSFARTIMFVKI